MPRFIRSLVLAPALTLLLAASASARSDTVIVKYRSGVSSIRRQEVAHRLGVRQTVGAVRGQGSRVVRVTGDPAAVAKRLDKSPEVLYAEPNVSMRVTATPDDPLFGQLSGLARIHAPAAWDALGLGVFPAVGGAPVAIVDTGIDARHEDLQGKAIACATAHDGSLSEGTCADDNDHGTHVAGTVAATANNGVGVAGVAFDSPLIVCKALGGSQGSGTTADVASCISWAHRRGAKVISMSLGGGPSTTLRNAVRSAWSSGGRRGSVLVAAAGNEGTSALDYPAGYAEAVSVAAVDSAGRHAGFSNANDDVEIAAPGVGILSTKRGGGYVRFSGTSMATPHVAGAAALLWDAHPRATAATIRASLDAAVTDLGSAGRDPRYGFGLLDLARIAAR